MATDTREQILARLLVIVQGVSGIATAARNALDISETKLPAIVIHDGDEEAHDNSQAVGLAGNVVTMTPQISILIGDTTDNIGTTANSFRAAVQKAILSDATLTELCGRVRPAGARYVSSSFTLFDGTDAAEVTLQIAISYWFNPRAF